MEADYEFSPEETDEDEDIILPSVRKRSQDKKGSKKGNIGKEEESLQKTNVASKIKKPKRKLKTVANVTTIGIKPYIHLSQMIQKSFDFGRNVF